MSDKSVGRVGVDAKWLRRCGHRLARTALLLARPVAVAAAAAAIGRCRCWVVVNGRCGRRGEQTGRRRQGEVVGIEVDIVVGVYEALVVSSHQVSFGADDAGRVSSTRGAAIRLVHHVELVLIVAVNGRDGRLDRSECAIKSRTV